MGEAGDAGEVLEETWASLMRYFLQCYYIRIATCEKLDLPV